MTYDSIILDIDGTIWNTTPIVAVGWNKAIQSLNLPVPPVTDKILQKEFGRTMDIIASDLWPALSSDQRAALLKKCCVEEHIAIEANSADITYSGVVETVQALSKKVPVFVVSNCQAGYIELMLKKTGMEPFVTGFICFGDNGFTKAQNIQYIVEKYQLKSPVYAGDTQGDADSCKEAGVPFIWAAYGFGTADAYVNKINSFPELLPLF